jgi:hypothetical protein
LFADQSLGRGQEVALLPSPALAVDQGQFVLITVNLVLMFRRILV